MTKLNDVLRRYMMESTTEDRIVLTREGLEKTEQAILEWVISEVIGEDESYDSSKWSFTPEAVARDELRDEQRTRVKQ